MAVQEIAIREFWRVFLRTEEAMFGGDSHAPELREHIERVHPDLEFDIGPLEGGKREIVISAGGIRDAFPAVEALARGAPPLVRWSVVRYRQRQPVRGTVTFQGLALSPEDIRFELSAGGPGEGIVLYMPGYARAEHSRYLALALLMLDTLLGEYDVEMKLGNIVIEPLGPGRGERAMTLDHLAGVFDASLHESRN
jgi:hypothetical protein